MKPYYQENKETVEFRISKRINTYEKIEEYKEVLDKAYSVDKDYFRNSYKVKQYKNAVKLK